MSLACTNVHHFVQSDVGWTELLQRGSRYTNQFVREISHRNALDSFELRVQIFIHLTWEDKGESCGPRRCYVLYRCFHRISPDHQYHAMTKTSLVLISQLFTTAVRDLRGMPNPLGIIYTALEWWLAGYGGPQANAAESQMAKPGASTNQLASRHAQPSVLSWSMAKDLLGRWSCLCHRLISYYRSWEALFYSKINHIWSPHTWSLF